MNDKELFPDNDLHDALADAYRQLATAAPSANTLTIRRQRATSRSRLALVAAAAVAIVAIPTVAVTLSQHNGGSNQQPAAPSAPTTSAIPSPSPSSDSPTPSSAAPTTPEPTLSGAVTRTVYPQPISTSPTAATASPSKAPTQTSTAQQGSAPADVGDPSTSYPTPARTAPADRPITEPEAVARVPRTPFTVGYLPAGYTFESAQTGRSVAKTPGVTVDFGFVRNGTETIYLSSADFDNALWLQEGQTTAATVNGRPARVMDGLVAMKVGGYLVLVQSKSPLPAGELRRIAEGLTFARDPDNAGSWFRTATAIPGADVAPTSTVTAIPGADLAPTSTATAPVAAPPSESPTESRPDSPTAVLTTSAFPSSGPSVSMSTPGAPAYAETTLPPTSAPVTPTRSEPATTLAPHTTG